MRVSCADHPSAKAPSDVQALGVDRGRCSHKMLYTMYMDTSLVRAARFTLLLAAGFVLGMLALMLVTATGKNSLWQKLGISHAKSGSPALADASCSLPSKDADKDVYFVSCGGFF